MRFNWVEKMQKLNNFKNLSKAIRGFNRKAPVVI